MKSAILGLGWAAMRPHAGRTGRRVIGWVWESGFWVWFCSALQCVLQVCVDWVVLRVRYRCAVNGGFGLGGGVWFWFWFGRNVKVNKVKNGQGSEGVQGASSDSLHSLSLPFPGSQHKKFHDLLLVSASHPGPMRRWLNRRGARGRSLAMQGGQAAQCRRPPWNMNWKRDAIPPA